MEDSISSDCVYEFPCKPCEEGNVNKEAIVYCVNCKDYLCKVCYTFHNRLAEAKQHQIMKQEDFRKGVTPVAVPVQSPTTDGPTETCTRHGKVVDMFCVDHDVVVCNTCVSLEHRACKEMCFIPEIACTRLTVKSIQTAQQNLSKHIEKITGLKQVRLEHKSRMVNEKAKCLSNVEERTKLIKDHVDTLADAVNKFIKDTYSESNDNLEVDIKTCEDTIKLFTSMRERLQTTDGANTSQKFVELKRAESLIRDGKKEAVLCKGNKQGLLTTTFTLGTDFKKLLSTETLFGGLKVDYYRIPLALELKERINVNRKADKSVCAVADLCKLPGGTIVITDWNNETIKALQYDTAYTVSDFLSMCNPPWGVCSVSHHDVAVTVPGSRQVYIVSVTGCNKMSITSSFKVDCDCHGIAFKTRRLYIGHALDSKLTVYDLQGNRLQTFCTDKQPNAVSFGKPFHLCVWPEEQRIAVAAASKGVIIIDEFGKLITQYKYPNKKLTYGLCFDDGGNMYIADFKSKDIVALGLDKKSTTLLVKLEKTPRALLFDKHTKSLFVTSEDSDQIQIYSIVY